MLEFVVTSTNQKKIEATRRVLESVLEGVAKFTVKGCQAASGVSDQPLSAEETKRGAVNRIFNAKCEADFIVSIESGVEREFDTFYSFTFAAIANKPRTRFGFGTSAKFQVPDHVAFGLESGKTLGEINHSPEGLIANVTGDRMKRTDLIAQSVMIALSFFHFYPTPIPPGVPDELLMFVDSLSPIQQNTLASQLLQLEFEAPVASPISNLPISPLTREYVFPRMAIDLVGGLMIESGRFAALLFAGKPDFAPFELYNGKSYLELQLTRLSKIQKVQNRIPVVIVTNEVNHSSIAAFLMEHGDFGLHSVTLLKQNNLPVRTESGRFILRSKFEVGTEQVGKGYIFDLLTRTGTLAKLEKLGVQYLFVQNLMNERDLPGCAEIGAIDFKMSHDMSIFATEDVKSGKFIGKRDGKIAVAEVDESIREQFKWKKTGQYMFSLEFIKRTKLPFHVKTVMRVSIDRGITNVNVYKKKLSDAVEMADTVIVAPVYEDSE